MPSCGASTTAGACMAGAAVSGRGALDSSESTSSNAKLTPGTRNNNADSGDMPASSARRTVMARPIHGNGSDAASITSSAPSLPPPRIASRVDSIGLRNSAGVHTWPVVV